MTRRGVVWCCLVASLAHRARAACRPQENTTWYWGSNHKTGTKLMKQVLGSLQRLGGGDKFMDRAFINAKAAQRFKDQGYRIMEFHHFHFPTTEEVADLLMDDGWAVLFFRDPTEIVLSGYFYHKTTHEDWVHARVPGRHEKALKNMEELVPALEDTCRARFDNASRAAACSALAHMNQGKTYAQILQHMPPLAGIFVEANRALHDISNMNRTWHAIKGYRVHPVDLGRTMTNFREEFRRVFEFLGVDNVTRCVELANRHNINDPSHGNVTKHAMDPALFELRVALKNFLSKSTWYQHVVEPLRIDMDYAPYVPPKQPTRPPSPLSLVGFERDLRGSASSDRIVAVEAPALAGS